MYNFEMDDLDLEMQGWRWGVTFLRTASYLSANERDDLFEEATKMYLGEVSEKRVKGDNYEGIMYKRGIDVMGSFVGVRFEAELDTSYGRDNMIFLVNEQTPSRRSYYHSN